MHIAVSRFVVTGGGGGGMSAPADSPPPTSQGMEVTQVVGFLPPPPGVSLGVVVSSYNNEFQMTVNADVESAGDAQPLLAAAEGELREIIMQRGVGG